jgi:hypothetical protein
MQQIISTLRQGLQKNIFVLGMMISISLLGLLIFVSAPVYAATSEELRLIPPDQRLTPEEKIERAYDLGEGAGLLEEARQESGNASETFNPKDKANLRNAKTSKDSSAPSLGEKAQGLIEKIIK